MPDLHHELAGHGSDSRVAIALTGKEFPAPLTQGSGLSHPQNGLGSLDKEMSHVGSPSFTNAEFDILAISTLTLPGVEANVGYELLGALKTARISDNSQQGKGVDNTYAQQLHAAEHQRLGAELPSDEAMRR